METLYSPDVFMPAWFKAPTERVALKWSKHAIAAGMNDRYGVIPVFSTLPLSAFRVVEIAAVGEEATKIVVRGHFDATRDVVFVLIPPIESGRPYFVKTVWFNMRNDTHKTLDRRKYAAA